MPLSNTVLLVNQTAGDITIVDLGSVVVPASGSIDLTNDWEAYQLRKSAHLKTQVDAGNLTFTVDGTPFDSTASQNLMKQVATSVDPNLTIEAAALHHVNENNPHGVNAKQTGGITYRRIATDNTTSTTTSLTPVTKMTISVTAQEGDRMRLDYSTEFNADANNKAVQVDLYDSSAATQLDTSIQQTNNSLNYFVFSGFRVETFTQDVTKVYAIRYWSSQGGVSCSVRNANLMATIIPDESSSSSSSESTSSSSQTISTSSSSTSTQTISTSSSSASSSSLSSESSSSSSP